MKKNPAELQLLKKNMVVIVFRNQNRQIEIQPNQMVTRFNLISNIHLHSFKLVHHVHDLLLHHYFTQVYIFSCSS